MVFNNTSNESEFNSGLAIIYQLDAIEKAMVEATIVENYKGYYLLLLSYFKTLFAHMNPTEQKDHIEYWKTIKTNHKELFEKLAQGKTKISTAVLDSFHLWELELRIAKQKHGLGMPERDARYTGNKR